MGGVPAGGHPGATHGAHLDEAPEVADLRILNGLPVDPCIRLEYVQVLSPTHEIMTVSYV